MSVRVMTAVWALVLQPGEKLVLLALADQADDEGLNCWPSVCTISKRSGQGERTVRRIIKALEKQGHLTCHRRDGTSTQYHVHPCQEGTPAKKAPLPRTSGTPAKLAPKPSRITKSPKKATPSPKRRAGKIDPFPRPEWADRQAWSDFLVNRKRKNLSNTATAHKSFLDDIARITNDEWPPGRLLQHAAAKGWGGIYDPEKGRQNGRNRDRNDHPGGTWGAAHDAVSGTLGFE